MPDLQVEVERREYVGPTFRSGVNGESPWAGPNLQVESERRESVGPTFRSRVNGEST